MRHFLCALCLSGVSVATGSATAAVVTWTAAGPVTALADPTNLSGGATQWSLQVTVDTLAPDLEPGDPALGTYGVSATLQTGTLTVPFGAELKVYDDVLDGIAIESSGVPSGWDSFSCAVTLQDSTATVFAGDAVPEPPPGVNAFDQTSFGLIGQTTGTPAIQAAGEVTTLTPEPASLALLVLGGVAVVRRRLGAAGRRTPPAAPSARAR